MIRMRPLSAMMLLDVWEKGLSRHPINRALILLSAACPEMSLQALAELSLGQRDAYLLTLREWIFGPRLTSLATCPACGKRLELTFNVSDIRAAPETESAGPLSLEMTDYEVRFRLPNSLDLMTLANANREAPTLADHLLLERCLLAADYQGQAQSVEQLPEEMVAAIAAKMAQADPQADIELALSCPACAHEWLSTFDIVSFFWQEINVWAYRILHEVHLMASAYGWSEADILAMSPRKRQSYLKMVNG